MFTDLDERSGFVRHARFTAGWEGVVMIHYSVDPDALREQVPFPLDLHRGRAWVSLVAFTLTRLRFRVGPAFPAHSFLNVRTYLPDRGIYFLAEWLDNPLCVLLGPRLYGLPYRYGRIDYRNQPADGGVRGTVRGRGVALDYAARVPDEPLATAEPGSDDEFLMERYVAYTERKGRKRLFRVDHAPWRFVPVDLDLRDVSLPASTGPWFANARLEGAVWSPGFSQVRMGRPEPAVDPGPYDPNRLDRTEYEVNGLDRIPPA
jgi:hypothetical protein